MRFNWFYVPVFWTTFPLMAAVLVAFGTGLGCHVLYLPEPEWCKAAFATGLAWWCLAGLLVITAVVDIYRGRDPRYHCAVQPGEDEDEHREREHIYVPDSLVNAVCRHTPSFAWKPIRGLLNIVAEFVLLAFLAVVSLLVVSSLQYSLFAPVAIYWVIARRWPFNRRIRVACSRQLPFVRVGVVRLTRPPSLPRRVLDSMRMYAAPDETTPRCLDKLLPLRVLWCVCIMRPAPAKRSPPIDNSRAAVPSGWDASQMNQPYV